MNRIANAINNLQPKIDELEPTQRLHLDTSMDVAPDEHFAYQETQARAHAEGKITPDEAMIVYAALGEVQNSNNGGWTEGTNLATKVAVTLIIGELVKSKLGI